MRFVVKVGQHNQFTSLLFAVGFLLLSTVALAEPSIPEKGTRPFTVTDDISLALLNSSVEFSPDGRYFVVQSDRGRLDLNRVESSLRLYRVLDAVEFLSHPSMTGELSPLWIVSKATYKNGPIISEVRWLPDSRAVAFLAKSASGNQQLCLADISTKTVHSLTPDGQHVTGFDVRSKQQFVYTALSPAIQRKAAAYRQAAVISGTGRSLRSLIFPEEATRPDMSVHDLSELWAVLNGKRFRVVDRSTGRPVPIHRHGIAALRLRPDCRSVVTALTITDIPAEWETLYPPPLPSANHRIRAGRQDPDSFTGQADLDQYVLLDLYSGETRSLTEAPVGVMLGWRALLSADWSADGRSVVLSNTFLKPENGESTSEATRPCVAVVDLTTDRSSCLQHVERGNDRGDEVMQQAISDTRFVHGSRNLVVITYSHHSVTTSSSTYALQSDGSWNVANATETHAAGDARRLEIVVKEALNERPVLVASDKRTNRSHVIWDPNPQLNDIKLGEVSVFKWQDKTGRAWVGGLYKPPDYVAALRYPLVIQTHGFSERSFAPSGAYTTSFAAQELAAVGVLVLQVEDCPIRGRPEEGPCQVAGYEAAVERLTSDGLVDPDRIGIIGFSRTCYYVLETLTTSRLRFKAALIADGINEGYLQYIVNLGFGDGMPHEAEAMIGAPPFGKGLYQWLERSPEFNMDRVTAPLQVLATTGQNVLFMWEPYSALRHLHKPVDLVILNSDEHVLTNPTERLISQGGTVDWFRFWLQQYEDPAPTKHEQYDRWNSLRGQQEAAMDRTRQESHVVKEVPTAADRLHPTDTSTSQSVEEY